MTTVTATNHREAIITLLASQNLPVKDLPQTLDDFIVMQDQDEIIGVAGLETYGNYGLLRSMAVAPAYRNQGIADNLLTQIENLAASKKLTAIYLLTETAAGYFTRKGYQNTNRDTVPADVQQSTEFSHVCPVSAIVMKKTINKL
ncbi:MAG: arsenic resistance N-acetyltransferase ArsN2 [Mucilaginibacter sp.]